MTPFSALSSFLKSEAWPHVLIFSLCSGALLLAALLSPPRPGGGSVMAAGMPVPPLCAFKRNTGYSCPGCGLTRSWVSTMHGRVWDGLRFHRFGWLVMLYAAAQAVRHGLWLAAPRWREALVKPGARLDRGLILVGVLLMINWAYGFGRAFMADLGG